jgi:hypothetical protein
MTPIIVESYQVSVMIIWFPIKAPTTTGCQNRAGDGSCNRALDTDH